jgi:hypothetical protein
MDNANTKGTQVLTKDFLDILQECAPQDTPITVIEATDDDIIQLLLASTPSHKIRELTDEEADRRDREIVREKCYDDWRSDEERQEARGRIEARARAKREAGQEARRKAAERRRKSGLRSFSQAELTLAKQTPAREVIAKVGLNLRKRGPWYVGPCPQCGGDDRFSVTDRRVKGYPGGSFKCRKCGIAGDMIKLVQIADGSSFPDAVRRLLEAR